MFEGKSNVPSMNIMILVDHFFTADKIDHGCVCMFIAGPGSSSGCTAVVALLKDNELYVANAGDSRCVVCRDGKAMDMSFDHKPEDKEELERIRKAGGRVTMDGRVNGGLNLSRAIGDHAYKTVLDSFSFLLLLMFLILEKRVF